MLTGASQLKQMFGGDLRMAWITSLLADYEGTVEPAWQQQAVTVEEFFAPFVRNAETHIQPKVRAEYEAAIAADREFIEGAMKPGDVLRPWWVGHYGVGRAGLAVLRGEQVVKAWKTAVLV
jgi:hypothetical protein